MDERNPGWQWTLDAIDRVQQLAPDVARLGLEATRALAHSVHVPGLDTVLSAVIEIYDARELVRRNRVECGLLAERCASRLCRVMKGISRTIMGEKVERVTEMEASLRSIAQTLTEIAGHLLQQQKLSWFTYYMKRKTLQRDIKTYHQRIEDAFGDFMFDAAVGKEIDGALAGWGLDGGPHVRNIVEQPHWNQRGSMQAAYPLEFRYEQFLRQRITRLGIAHFFHYDDAFIRTLVKRAVVVQQDSSDVLGQWHHLQRLLILSLYRLIFYCGDNKTMGLDGRFDKQQQLVTCMAQLATKLLPDYCGVELRFVNYDVEQTTMRAEDVEKVLRGVSLAGHRVEIGTGLKSKVLRPFTEHLTGGNKSDKRPCLICIITDSEPVQEPLETFQEVITQRMAELARARQPRQSLRFSVYRIGAEIGAAKFLHEVSQDIGIKDVVYCAEDSVDAVFKGDDTSSTLQERSLSLLMEPFKQVLDNGNG